MSTSGPSGSARRSSAFPSGSPPDRTSSTSTQTSGGGGGEWDPALGGETARHSSSLRRRLDAPRRARAPQDERVRPAPPWRAGPGPRPPFGGWRRMASASLAGWLRRSAVTFRRSARDGASTPDRGRRPARSGARPRAVSPGRSLDRPGGLVAPEASRGRRRRSPGGPDLPSPTRRRSSSFTGSRPAPTAARGAERLGGRCVEPGALGSERPRPNRIREAGGRAAGSGRPASGARLRPGDTGRPLPRLTGPTREPLTRGPPVSGSPGDGDAHGDRPDRGGSAGRGAGRSPAEESVPGPRRLAGVPPGRPGVSLGRPEVSVGRRPPAERGGSRREVATQGSYELAGAGLSSLADGPISLSEGGRWRVVRPRRGDRRGRSRPHWPLPGWCPRRAD